MLEPLKTLPKIVKPTIEIVGYAWVCCNYYVLYSVAF